MDNEKNKKILILEQDNNRLVILLNLIRELKNEPLYHGRPTPDHKLRVANYCNYLAGKNGNLRVSVAKMFPVGWITGADMNHEKVNSSPGGSFSGSIKEPVRSLEPSHQDALTEFLDLEMTIYQIQNQWVELSKNPDHALAIIAMMIKFRIYPWAIQWMVSKKTAVVSE